MMTTPGSPTPEATIRIFSNHKEGLEPSTYGLIFIYTALAVISGLLVMADNNFALDSIYSSLYRPHEVIQNATSNFQQVPQSVSRATEKVRESLGFKAAIIVLITVAIMRYLVRYVLNIVYSWRATHQPSKRVIKLAKPGIYISSDKVTNFISSTVFVGSWLKVSILSFFYGGAVYLSQRIQVWCMCISTVQLLLFKTGKSFWPLIIFTVFMAYLYARNQIITLKRDRDTNSRKVTVVEGEEVKTVTRGEIRPGSIVQVKVGEEVPADLVIIGVHSNSESKKKAIFMNEVQVTGENNPVRKKAAIDPEEVIDFIEIEDVKVRKVNIELKGGEKRAIPDIQMAFANSRLESRDESLFITGITVLVAFETKALSAASNYVKQSSPFTEYTSKGFLLSLGAMLALALLNAVTSYFNIDALIYGNEEDPLRHTEQIKKTSFITVLVNHIMYLNMMVPQAMEQLRFFVCALLTNKFEQNIKCNDSLVVDVLGYTERIVSDKTGTLTQNKMEAVASMVFNEEERGIEPIMLHNDQQNIRPLVLKNEKALWKNAMAIYATSGMEPEELAMASFIQQYSKLLDMETSDPDDRHPGYVQIQVGAHQTKLKVNTLGFIRPLLSKTSIVKDEQDGQHYVIVQAGGDEFWKEILSAKSQHLQEKFALWEKAHSQLPHYNGAPRIWSHGMKPITAQEAKETLDKWYATFLIENEEERVKEQAKIALEVLEGVEMISKTYMVDTYRRGVVKGIKKLAENGKQFFICTGDSTGAAKTIATQLHFPSNHIILDGSSTKALEADLQRAIEESSKGLSSTLFFDKRCMDLLRQLEQEEGFENDIIEMVLLLLSVKNPKTSSFMNYGVFCRATPDLKPWVVKLVQYKHKATLIDYLSASNYRVMAVGDGANDINMLKIADVSLGIKSGETLDVCSQASFYCDEWEPIVNLLLKEGPVKAYSIAMMIKLTFLKHWMTAFALFADLIHAGFPLLPMEPTNPMLMMIYNGVVFTQIASHTISDRITPKLNKRTSPFSFRAFMRWGIGAAMSGIAITLVARWLFPSAASRDFGALIQVSQACSLTIYMYMSTNSWTDDQKHSKQADQVVAKKSSRKNIASVYAGSLSLTFAVIASIFALNREYSSPLNKMLVITCILAVAGYPSLIVLRYLNRDIKPIKKAIEGFLRIPTDQLVPMFIKWSHTKHGRILPIMVFFLLVKVFCGVSLLALILVSIFSSLISALIFLFVISRMGFLRAVFDGKSVAVGFFCLIIGFLLGRYSNTVL